MKLSRQPSRTCGYCYDIRKSSHLQKLVRAVGDVEGIPCCERHYRRHAPGSSAFRYRNAKRCHLKP